MSCTSQTLTTPRKVHTPNRLVTRGTSSTPKRGSPSNLRHRPHRKLNTPDNSFIVDEKPPNGVFRKDSFNDSGSDSELDEPFFNFDSEECDAEEQYAEALRDELKKLQVCTKLQGRTKISHHHLICKGLSLYFLSLLDL